MECSSLLELLYSAVDRSRTVQATVHRVSHQARELELLRLHGLLGDPPRIPPEEGLWPPPSELVEATTILWATRPDQFRSETSISSHLGQQTTVTVKQGETFWSCVGSDDVHSNEGRVRRGQMWTDEERLLDPSPLLGSYRFEIGSTTRVLGRDAVQVEATARPGTELSPMFGPLNRELSLIIDAERGVLLRVGTWSHGEETSMMEIISIEFDVPVDPEVFRPMR